MPIISEGASSSVAGSLFKATGLTLTASGDTVTANTVNAVTGATGPFDVSQVGSCMVVVNVDTVTGTSPSLGIFLDAQDDLGDWLQVSQATNISGAAQTAAGVVYGIAPATGYILTARARLRWVVSGTTPSFNNVGLNVIGR